MQHDDGSLDLKRTADSRASDEQLDDMFERLEDDLRAQPPTAHIASLPSWLRRGVGLAVAGAVLLGTYLMLARPDLTIQFAHWPFLATTLFTLAALILAATAALRPYHRPALNRTQVGLTFVTGLFAVVAMAVVPGSTAGADVAHEGLGLPCFAIGSAVGAVLLLALRLLDRGQPFGWLLSAAAAALLGNLMLQLHCAASGLPHRLVGHAGVFVAYGLVVWMVWAWKGRSHTAPLR